MKPNRDFNRNDRSRDRNPRFGGGGGRGYGRPQMHKAVCSSCGRDCELPFVPTGNRAVFCSNCFDKDGSRNAGRSDGGNRFDRFEEKQMFSATCDKCGKECEVPFKPTSGKPVYCSDCFSSTSGRYQEGGNKSAGVNSGMTKEELEKEFERLNVKLNEIQSLLTSLTMKGASPIKKKIPINTKVKKTAAKKTAAKKKA
jgi:CxxC-x17-CxxC domain-containing protein